MPMPTAVTECHVHPAIHLRWRRDETAGLEWGWCRTCRDDVGFRPILDGAERVATTRAAELARTTVAPLPDRFESAVVGVTFVAGYPEVLWRVEWAWVRRKLLGESVPGVDGDALVAELVRNPANEVDANAVEVHVPAICDDTWGDPMIGHLPRAVAARLAPHLDAGEVWRVWVHGVRLNAAHMDQPGLRVHIARNTGGCSPRLTCRAGVLQ